MRCTYTYHTIHVKKVIATSMFLHICDPQYLVGQNDFLHRSFLKLGYPHRVLDIPLSKGDAFSLKEVSLLGIATTTRDFEV